MSNANHPYRCASCGLVQYFPIDQPGPCEKCGHADMWKQDLIHLLLPIERGKGVIVGFPGAGHDWRFGCGKAASDWAKNKPVIRTPSNPNCLECRAVWDRFAADEDSGVDGTNVPSPLKIAAAERALNPPAPAPVE